MNADRAIQNYHTLLDPLLGRSKKEELEAKLGLPDRVNTLPNAEIWHYFSIQAYYIRDVSNPAIGYNPIYDAVTIEFDNQGLFQNWKAQVAR